MRLPILSPVLERPLRYIAVVASAIVLLSFGLFAIDETRDASEQSDGGDRRPRGATRSSDPSASQERARERAHSRVREAIDDADDVLVAPFAGLVDGSDSSGCGAACRRSSPWSSTASGCRSWPASRGDELDRRGRAGAEVRFGAQADFAIGVEEELILRRPGARGRCRTRASTCWRAWASPTHGPRATPTPTPTRR